MADHKSFNLSKLDQDESSEVELPLTVHVDSIRPLSTKDAEEIEMTGLDADSDSDIFEAFGSKAEESDSSYTEVAPPVPLRVLSDMPSRNNRRNRGTVLSVYLGSEFRNQLTTTDEHQSTRSDQRQNTRPANTDQKQRNEDKEDEGMLKAVQSVLREEGMGALRTMPISLSEKRELKRQMSVETPGITHQILFRSRVHFKTRVSEGLRDAQLWRAALKRVGARFGSGVLSYFLFLRMLIQYNVLLLLFTGLFLTLPQAIYPPEHRSQMPSDQTVTGLELLTGAGVFSDTLMYYGYYSRSNAAAKQYSVPLAYVCVVLLLLVITFFILLYRVSKYLGMRWSVFQLDRDLVVKVFCYWDYKIYKKASVLQQRANISTQLKELLSEKVQGEERRGWLEWALAGLAWCVSLLFTALCSYGIYEYLIPSSKEKDDLKLPLLVSCMNLVLPAIFGLVSKIEACRSPSGQTYIAICRNFLLKLSVLTLLCFHWLRNIGGNQQDLLCPNVPGHEKAARCWEDDIGQQLYRYMVMDLIFAVVYTFCAEFLWRLLTCHAGLKRPVFDIARNVLELIYGQTLTWFGLLFSPLLPAVQIIKLILLFYIKKESLMQNCRPSNRPWRANHMSAIFTCLLFFPAFTGAALCVLYTMTQLKPSCHCGPFRTMTSMFSLETEWENVLKTHPSMSNFYQAYTYLMKNPVILFCAVGIFLVVIYVHIQIDDSQKKMTSLLEEQIKKEGEDKAFLISRLQLLQQQEPKSNS
ncbi:transmembrane channel-like protein 6 isoform X2 [Denticeps clupeoides]|uniref:transmembrane channel-like protein 6 isoform X2 n=1 Tax=Denticeps clupeoides TaxID=299321 RepID=UPI0010A57AE5|nr:transmembrane channel-like protein 6 isoform X2 [Denticeps clupeoides]